MVKKTKKKYFLPNPEITVPQHLASPSNGKTYKPDKETSLKNSTLAFSVRKTGTGSR
jgi:hypothetical protein